MKIIWIVLLIVLGMSFVWAQSSSNRQATINPQKFDAELLSQLIEGKINALRTQKKRDQLANNIILKKAALTQTTYCADHKKLSHEQRNRKLRTPWERVAEAGGGFEIVGENLAMIGFTIETIDKQKRVLYPTYEEAAERIVNGWRKSKGHYKNILEKSYEQSGVVVILSENAIYATQVFGKLK
ncbi:MAG: CAP domain-containing protein [Chitinophagales bacterium]|nr:CAP domain-containing protein [Bacteroidota bacterium]